MNSHIPHSRLWLIIAAGLAATLHAGCVHCPGNTNQINYSCSVEWPCFGYHSTCWRPWPEECVTCPSPYLPLPVPAEAVPAPPVPDSSLPVEPMLQPMPPMPTTPEPKPPAPPADPVPDANPASYLDPRAVIPENLPPVTLPEESSSRRRHIEGAYSLDNQGAYSHGNQSAYSHGNQGAYSHGNQGAYSHGNQSAYSLDHLRWAPAGSP